MASNSSLNDNISVHSHRPHPTVEELFPGESEALLQYYDKDLGHIDLSRIKGPICGECKVKYGDPENLPDKLKKPNWKDWFFVFFKIFVILLLLGHLAAIMIMEYYTLYDLSGAWLLETTLLHGIPSYMAVMWVLICMFMRTPKCWCFCVYKRIPWCVCKCGRITKKTVDEISACLHKVIIGVATCYFIQIFALMGTNAGMYHSVWPSKIHCECNPLSDTMPHHNTTKDLNNLYECDCFIPHDEVFMRKFIIPEVSIPELQKAFIRDGVYIDISGYEPHHLFYGVIPPPRNHTDEEFPDLNSTSDETVSTTSQPVDLETTEDTLTTSVGSTGDDNKPSTKGTDENNPKKPDIDNNNPGKTNDATSLPKRVKRDLNSLDRVKRQDENLTDTDPTSGGNLDPPLPIDYEATDPVFSSNDAIQQAKAQGPKTYRSPTLTFVTIEKPYFKMMLLIMQMTAITCIFLLTVFSGLDILRDHPKINKAVTIYIGMWSKGFVNVFDAMVLYDDLFEEVQYFKDEPAVMLWILLIIEYAIVMVPFEYMLNKECLHKSKAKYGALVSLKAFIIIAYNGPFVWMRIELITQESGGSERKGLVSMLMMVKEIFFIFVSMIQMIITNCKPEIRDGFYVFKFAPDSLKMDLSKQKEEEEGGGEEGGEEEGGGGGGGIEKVINFFKRKEGEDKRFFRRMTHRIPFIGKRLKKRDTDAENKNEPETNTKERKSTTLPPGDSIELSDPQQERVSLNSANMSTTNEDLTTEGAHFVNVTNTNEKLKKKCDLKSSVYLDSMKEVMPKKTDKKQLWVDNELQGRKGFPNGAHMGDSYTSLKSLSGHIPSTDLWNEMKTRRKSVDSGFESCYAGVSTENLPEKCGSDQTISMELNVCNKEMKMDCYGDCKELKLHEGLSKHLHHYDVMPQSQEFEIRVVADGKTERPRSGMSSDGTGYGQAEGRVVEDVTPRRMGDGNDPSSKDWEPGVLGRPKWLFEDPQKRYSSGTPWFAQPNAAEGGDADDGMTMHTISRISSEEQNPNTALPGGGDGDGDPRRPQSYLYKLIQKCVICGKYFLIDSTPKVNRVLGAISDIPINDTDAKKALLQVIAKHFPKYQKHYVPPNRAFKVLPQCMKPKTTDDLIQESQLNLIPEVEEDYKGYEVKGIGEELLADYYFGGGGGIGPKLGGKLMTTQETQTMDMPYVPLMRARHKPYMQYTSDDTCNYSPATDQWSNYFGESLSSLSMGTESTSFMYRKPRGRPKSALPYSPSDSYGAYDPNRPKLRKSESDRRRPRTSWGDAKDANKTTAEVHMEYEKAMKVLEATLEGTAEEPTPFETKPLNLKPEFPKILDDLLDANEKELQMEKKKDPDIEEILTNLQSQLPPAKSLKTEKEEILPTTKYEEVGSAKDPAKKVDSSIALYDVECGVEMVPPVEFRKQSKSDIKKAPTYKAEVEKPDTAAKSQGKALSESADKNSDKPNVPLDVISSYKDVKIKKDIHDDKKPIVPPDVASGSSTPVRLKKPTLPAVFNQDFTKERDTPDKNIKDDGTKATEKVPGSSQSTPLSDPSPGPKAWRHSLSKLKPYLALTKGKDNSTGGQTDDEPISAKSVVPKKSDKPDDRKENDGPVMELMIIEDQVAPRKMNAPVEAKESSEEPMVTPNIIDEPDLELKKTNVAVVEPQITQELVPLKKTDRPVVPKKTDGQVVPKKTDVTIRAPKNIDGGIVEPEVTVDLVAPRKTHAPVVEREKSEEPMVMTMKPNEPWEPKINDTPVVEPELTEEPVVPRKLDDPVIIPKKTDVTFRAPKNTDGTVVEPEVTADLVAPRKIHAPVVEREKSEEPVVLKMESDELLEPKKNDTPVVEPELTAEPVVPKKIKTPVFEPKKTDTLVPKKEEATATKKPAESVTAKSKPNITGKSSSIPMPTRQTTTPSVKATAASGGENTKPKSSDNKSSGQGHVPKMAPPSMTSPTTSKPGKQDRKSKQQAYSSTDEEDLGEKRKAKPPPRLLKARPESMKKKEGESSPSGRDSDDPGLALEKVEGGFSKKDTDSSDICKDEIKETCI